MGRVDCRLGLVRALLVSGVLFGPACAAPAVERVSPPSTPTATPGSTAAQGSTLTSSAASDAEPVGSPSATSGLAPASASASKAAVSSTATSAGSATEPVSTGLPRELTPEFAVGTCSGRSTLQTAKGEVSCYPYRCQGGRCLLTCKRDEDCAGARGPTEMAEHGWPLACAAASATCYPLPPWHVNGP
ncbi:MAG: hypothetical protein IPK82_10740 [Polyangiaceae bacterium]|nr:hypothetical protein [Polyangiaceae bacterium]